MGRAEAGRSESHTARRPGLGEGSMERGGSDGVVVVLLAKEEVGTPSHHHAATYAVASHATK